MRHPSVKLALAIVLALSANGPALAETVGVREIVVPTPERGSSLEVNAWYPTSATATDALIGDNAVFRGVAAARNGPVAGRALPLVLIAHGGFRSAPDVASWLASALAAKGFVAVVMRPPAIPGGRATRSIPNELSLRPADMTAALRAVEKDQAFMGRIDASRIGAIGFFLGGHAVLELAGARVDAAVYAQSCDDNAVDPDCAWLASGGVDLHRVDARVLERSNRDVRIKSVVAVDPELTQTFTHQSLGAISIPVHVRNLGSPKPGMDASKMAAHLPGANYAIIPEAGPFSSFGECKPKGSEILKEEGGETLCDDAGAMPRAEMHKRLAAMFEAILRESLAVAN
jgi:predicted dienelactone hydrolase